MEINFETIRDILERRLHQADIERLLQGLSETDKTQLFVRITELVRRTSALVDISNRVSDTLSLDVLFPRLMEVVTETLNVERSSLFLYDADTKELFSRVMQGNAMGEVRFPANLGIAGSVFSNDAGAIIHDAYADPRFNPQVDKQSGFRTRSILCLPLKNRRGAVFAVAQLLNRRDGRPFEAEDERKLHQFTESLGVILETLESLSEVRAVGKNRGM